jgi:hypothetical protein
VSRNDNDIALHLVIFRFSSETSLEHSTRRFQGSLAAAFGIFFCAPTAPILVDDIECDIEKRCFLFRRHRQLHAQLRSASHSFEHIVCSLFGLLGKEHRVSALAVANQQLKLDAFAKSTQPSQAITFDDVPSTQPVAIVPPGGMYKLICTDPLGTPIAPLRPVVSSAKVDVDAAIYEQTYVGPNETFLLNERRSFQLAAPFTIPNGVSVRTKRTTNPPNTFSFEREIDE